MTTRAEWKAFHHSIRHDARSLCAQRSGYPCVTRCLIHNGQEWSFTRCKDVGLRWTSYLRKSVIRERPWRENHASEMNDLPHYHRRAQREPSHRARMRGAIRITLKMARVWREDAGL